jgi:lipopolysaccharide transport system permease protein
MYILLLPLILLNLAILSIGFGLLFSSITAKYRDLTLAMNFLIQLWMFLTPIVYPLSEVPQKFKLVILLNPMTAPVELFRKAFLGTSSITLLGIMISCIISVIIFFLGVIVFNKVEKTFMDTV